MLFKLNLTDQFCFKNGGIIMYRLVFLLLLFFNVVFADVDGSLKQAEMLYKKLVNSGDKKSLEKAEMLIKDILKEDAKNAKALMILGGIYTLKGKYSKMPWNKMKHVKRGLAYMDKAVNLEPENIGLRIERAFNNMNLPSFFGRKTVVEKDFDFIFSNNKFQYFPPEIKQKIYLQAGIFYKNNSHLEKAKKMWENVLAIDNKSELAANASEYLKKYNSK